MTKIGLKKENANKNNIENGRRGVVSPNLIIARD
jgi:hypothetical protein